MKNILLRKLKDVYRIAFDPLSLFIFFVLSFCLTFLTTNIEWVNNILCAFRLTHPNLFYFILFLCPFLIATMAYFVGQHYYYKLRIENIVHYLEDFEEGVNHWKFRDYVKDVNESIIPSEIHGKYIVYGINFSKTADNDEERKKLVEIIENDRVNEIIFVCVHSEVSYIENNVKTFLEYVNKETYNKMVKVINEERLQRMRIYPRKDYSVHNAIITIVDDDFLLYQLRYRDDRDKDYNSIMSNLAIKIKNKETIDIIKSHIMESINDSEPINLSWTNRGSK